MTTMSGQGASPNAGPVARLQAELEAVEGELELVRAELAATLRAKQENDERFMIERDAARAERDSARALVPETLVCW